MGRAVYDSGLPTDIGVKLYDELSKAEAGLVLGEALHLIYIIMLDHPFKIFGWSHWGKLFGSLPSTHKKVSVCPCDCSILSRLCYSLEATMVGVFGSLQFCLLPGKPCVYRKVNACYSLPDVHVTVCCIIQCYVIWMRLHSVLCYTILCYYTICISVDDIYIHV